MSQTTGPAKAEALAHELREVADILERVPEMYGDGELTGMYNRCQKWLMEVDDLMADDKDDD